MSSEQSILPTDEPCSSLDVDERRAVDDALAWIDRPPRGREDERTVRIVARLVDVIDRLVLDLDVRTGSADRRSGDATASHQPARGPSEAWSGP